MNAWKLIASDYRKLRKYGASPLAAVFLYQGFWALFQYRISHAIYTAPLPKFVKIIPVFLLLLWQKVIEILTGISLPASATIGHSFYIGHFGHIIINPKAVIGNNCNISQGCTIGISGRGENRGVPVIGNNVYMGANAVVAGNITIGNNVLIGALSLVVEHVPDNAVVMGVPAAPVSYKGSSDYIG